jgi:hypothetical protein
MVIFLYCYSSACSDSKLLGGITAEWIQQYGYTMNTRVMFENRVRPGNLAPCVTDIRLYLQYVTYEPEYIKVSGIQRIATSESTFSPGYPCYAVRRLSKRLAIMLFMLAS